MKLNALDLNLLLVFDASDRQRYAGHATYAFGAADGATGAGSTAAIARGARRTSATLTIGLPCAASASA